MRSPAEALLLDGDGFLFIRHGQSEANAAGLVAGWLESPLSELGRRQALEAAASLDACTPDRIWSSGSMRALETARLISARFNLEPMPVAGLRERSWGTLEGKPLGERPRSSIGDTPPGGESWEEFAVRTMAALRTLSGTPRTLLVAHSGTFRVLRESLLGEDPEGAAVSNCRIVVFRKALGVWSANPAKQ